MPDNRQRITHVPGVSYQFPDSDGGGIRPNQRHSGAHREDKIEKGEFPLLRTALDPDKRSARYINMVKLAQMADAVEFLHPALKGG